MKILQVMAGNDHGGAETAFVDMCLAMHEAGMDIEVATRANNVRVPRLEQAGIPVHTMPFGGPIDIFTGWKLSRIIKKFSPLIVQTWMARAAQKTPNWKHVKTPQRYLVASRLGGYYKIKNFKSADYFTTITPDIKRHLVDGGIEADKIRAINNFAETETVVKSVTKADFNTPEDAPVLLSLGRLHTSKAYDVLLKALVELPGVYSWIAGEGPQRTELEKLAKDLGVKDRVRFLGWRTDRSALLRACDICVFASRIEPFGTVFAQAWAEKVPVIVSDADGPKQFCRDGEDSLMVAKNDAVALAAAVRRLTGDKALQQKLVENGYQRYVNEFTKEKSVAAYVDFFIEILKKEDIL
jgi:glycosyltransferase involved in cell wall biosynthesis